MLVIDPDECIDCTLCEPECPASAIFSEAEVPPDQVHFLDINRKHAKEWPSISETRPSCPNADSWNGISEKYARISNTMSHDEFLEVLRDPTEAEQVIRAYTLTREQIELAINHDNSMVRLAIIKRIFAQNSIEFAFSDDQISRGLADNDAAVRLEFVKVAALNKEQVHAASKDPDPRIRQFIFRFYEVSKDSILPGLNDQDAGVRAAIASNYSIPLLDHDFLNGLSDSDWTVKSAFSRRVLGSGDNRILSKFVRQLDKETLLSYLTCENGRHLAKESLLKLLELKDERVTSAIARRPDFSDLPITSEEFAVGLTASDKVIRRACANNIWVTPTAKQIENGLADEDSGVRLAFASRHDYIPMPHQIEQGLTDPDTSVREAFAVRDDISLTPEQIDRGLTDEYDEIRTLIASRADYSPSTKQVDRGLRGWEATAFLKRTDVTLTKKQVQRGLTHRYSEIRAAFAASKKYTPTPEQIERGLQDEWLIVRQAFASRSDVVLSPEQIDRSQDPRYSLTNKTDFENYDEDYILEAPQCSCCGHRLFGNNMDFCEHVAFVYSEDNREIWIENGAYQEEIKFLDGRSSKKAFNEVCKKFSLKKQSMDEEGMACGPISSSYIIAYRSHE